MMKGFFRDEWGIWDRGWMRKYYVRKSEQPIVFWLTVLFYSAISGGACGGLVVLSFAVLELYGGIEFPLQVFDSAWQSIAIVAFIVSIPIFGSRKEIWPWWANE